MVVGNRKAGVRIQNRIPQTYELSLVKSNNETEVIRIPLDQNQTAQITIDGSDYDNVYFIVSGTSRFTRQEAFYRILIQPAE